MVVSVGAWRPSLTWLNVSLDQLCLLPECTPVLPKELTLWNPRCPPAPPQSAICEVKRQTIFQVGQEKVAKAQPSLLCLACLGHAV